MPKIEILENIILENKHRSKNEADTRYKIIDKLLRDIFDWPDNAINFEEHVESGYIDYTLFNPVGVPLLIIEAKREGKYFEIPKKERGKKSFQKIITEELLTDENIGDA